MTGRQTDRGDIMTERERDKVTGRQTDRGDIMTQRERQGDRASDR